MIIGSKFSKKYEAFLEQVGVLANGDPSHRISVQKLKDLTQLDSIEMKNVIEYLDNLDYINIETIGGPLLYGHVTITEAGLEKYRELKGEG